MFGVLRWHNIYDDENNVKNDELSSHYYNVLLDRWARMKNIRIGNKSEKGYSFYVRPRGSVMEFIVSCRGAKTCRGELKYSFMKNNKPYYGMEQKNIEICRRIAVKSRREAFKEASRIYFAITGQM